jgi:serine/threonine-protein kinase ATR
LTEKDRSQVIQYLAMIPCAANGSLVISRDQGGAIHYSKCYLCDGIPLPESISLDDNGCRHISQDIISLLSRLVNSQVFQASRRPRVLGMVAVKRFTVHFNDPNFVDLEVSPLAQWCLTSLHSSIRELRILAG